MENPPPPPPLTRAGGILTPRSSRLRSTRWSQCCQEQCWEAVVSGHSFPFPPECNITGEKHMLFFQLPSPASGGTADSQLTDLSSPCKLMRERDHFWGDLKSQGALEPRPKLHLEVKSQRQCTAFGGHCMPCRWATVSTQSFNLTFLWVHIQCPRSHKNLLAGSVCSALPPVADPVQSVRHHSLSHFPTFSMFVRIHWKWLCRFPHAIHAHGPLMRKEFASVTKLNGVEVSVWIRFPRTCLAD